MPSEKPVPVELPKGVPDSASCSEYGIRDVVRERRRQDVKWGVSRNLHPQLWLPVLAEEVGEAAQAILKGEREHYREEMVHVAAVALAAIQDWDWQQEYGDLLPPPQVVGFAWERAEAAINDLGPANDGHGR